MNETALPDPDGSGGCAGHTGGGADDGGGGYVFFETDVDGVEFSVAACDHDFVEVGFEEG